MNRFFVCLFALAISFSMVASATAEWVTVCDGNSCHREWRGPVQRMSQNVQQNRAYRVYQRQSSGSYGGYNSCGSYRSMGAPVRVYRSYGSQGGYSSQSSHGGYSTPSSVEPAPAETKATVPTSAKPATFERPKPSIKGCSNPACNCADCKCEDCKCGLARIPRHVVEAVKGERARLPQNLVDYRNERLQLARVPAALLASR